MTAATLSKRQVAGDLPPTGPVAYLLLVGRKVVYVGSTGSLLARLAAHVRSGKVFERWVAHPCATRVDAYDLERLLIAEHMPRLNRIPGRGAGPTPRQSIRCTEEVWAGFGAAAHAAGTDRTAVLRTFVDWYMRKPGARPPVRPPAAAVSLQTESETA